MNAQEMNELVAAVTAQVLSAMRQDCTAAAEEGREKLLVIGDPARVPEKYARHSLLCPLDDYSEKQNIHRYCRVFITELTQTQLVDLAQGRPSDAACRAVIEALLNGIEIAMLDAAPAHRKFAGKCGAAFYQLLEGYVRTLQIFGVKLIGAELRELRETAGKPPLSHKPLPPLPCGSTQRLITEADALRLLRQSEGEVRIPGGSLLTPSARDAFSQAKIHVIYD